MNSKVLVLDAEGFEVGYRTYPGRRPTVRCAKCLKDGVLCAQVRTEAKTYVALCASCWLEFSHERWPYIEMEDQGDQVVSYLSIGPMPERFKDAWIKGSGSG
jgi:hypothetical protein